MKRIVVLLAALISIWGVTAFAGTQDTIINMEIPAVLSLEWDTNGVDHLDLTGVNAITLVEFANGYKDSIAGGNLLASSNANYDITIKAVDTYFSGGSGTKPTSDMLVDVNSAGFMALDGTNEVTLVYNNPPETNGVKTLTYKIIFTPNDTQGVYFTTLTYTIKATL